MNKPGAPVFLNLLQIHLPVTAILSILHRLSGAILFLILPGLIYVLQESLHSAERFNQLLALLVTSLPARLLAFVLLWAIFHHLFAGLRFLLLDLEWGIQRRQARLTAWLVNALALLTTVLLWGCL
ncbi:succinate dehydrogenase, cytochrome b556 subunit [Sulfuriflexus mobilis]|uniref:succinate dehydrogenase, cytochrome b556 subunit n=1 Tax=Sulfuriflexus mobilis TaxID=1811807 RepID=UPI000F8367F8|nr:succinate dehydrogenase, cytochrome b556 subunit [Sulfuriflexus mobilis]